ncbi:Protein Largen Mesenchymal stem cell protein DSC54 Proline-rich protein 16 [Channa argus]|uniref:Protein Largen Mesenchymal stem cell protein DSC54 Proline-rich protein 16 n=1 Tax=Channa argus TaxID=215402 RepID=A0A6G1PLP9_CHAAH|nr:Protein Largen Mesenchymal stem cell protein DSC54 Proline-rich protein 16 [Channa argus]KAK2907878.1 hypothetical protein Q8A73_008951 [Channa argus]
MFSDSRASAPGEQKSFKPHAPHFIPWLRNNLKPHHSSDLGLNGPYKSGSEVRNTLIPLERPKGIGLFSIQGKDRAKKGELRCNGVGMARMLPVVLRGQHILPGSLEKQKGDIPARWNQSAELEPDPNTQISPGDESQSRVNSSTCAQDNHSFVRNNQPSLLQSKNDGSSPPVRKYGPLAGPPSVPVPVHVVLTEEPNSKVPVVMCMEDRRGKAWDCTSHTTYNQRDLHSSSWLSSDTQGPTERQCEFSSSFSYIKQQSSNCQSQRDLTVLRKPPVEGFNGSLNGVIVSTEVPQTGPSCTATPGAPRKHRTNSERISILGQNQTWVQHRKHSEGDSQRKEAVSSMKVVRNQIKRVVGNLEQVLTALRDVQQEMKEVVQQIDYLTSSIDLNEEEHQGTRGDNSTRPPSNSSSSSGSSSSELTVGSTVHRPSEPKEQPGATDSSNTLRGGQHSVQLCPLSSGFSSERSRTLRFTCSIGSSSRPHKKTLTLFNSPQLQNLTTHDFTLSPQRSLPTRPPTPGLSPLTVKLQPPSSPGSQPHSSASSSSIRLSPISPPSPLPPKPHPPPALSPSVIIETKVGSYQTPRSHHPSAGPLFPSTKPPSASCPPTDIETQTVSNAERERQASPIGSVGAIPKLCTTTADKAKPPSKQGHRGRKPPPYPHHRLSEHTKKLKEPRKAPPYPEKRRLLSTTV